MNQFPLFCSPLHLTNVVRSSTIFGRCWTSLRPVPSTCTFQRAFTNEVVRRSGWSAGVCRMSSTSDVGGGDKDAVSAYDEWISGREKARHSSGITSSAIGASSLSGQGESDGGANDPQAPAFPHATLFHEGAEVYAYSMTTQMGPAFDVMLSETGRHPELFAPAMIGRLVGQFLKMLTQLMKPERVLDIGTFTGCSAIAFATGGAKHVVTLEANANTASVARKVFSQIDRDIAQRIELIETDATKEVERMVDRGERFDVVCLDADKTHYKHYYQCAVQLLNVGGIIVADNALGSLVFDDDDVNKQAIHEFAQHVNKDHRVEQVMLTVREGLLIARKIAE